MTLQKIDRRDGIVAESFGAGSKEFAEEYRRIRAIFSEVKGIQADRDFEAMLRGAQFSTAGFVYKLVD